MSDNAVGMRFVNLTKIQEEELSCGICLAIFSDPKVTPCCRQTYCNKCIKKWLKEHNSCPNVRMNALNRSELLPAPRVIANILNKLQVTCKFSGNGCDAIMLFENLDHHIVNCLHNPEKTCAVCDPKYGNKTLHNCCENLIAKVKSLETSNVNLDKQYACLESNYCRIIEENHKNSQEITRLTKIIIDIKQMVTENKSQVHVSSNSCLKQKEYSIRFKIVKFSTNFAKQYSSKILVRNMRWGIWCQTDKNCKWFGFHLHCNEKNAFHWSVYAVLKIISQKQGGTNFCRYFREIFTNDTPEHGFSNFICGNNLLNARNGYVMNDTIILEAVFSIESLIYDL